MLRRLAAYIKLKLYGAPVNDLVLSLGSLVVGIVASVLVSAYYFRRSMRKSLTPYVQFYSSPFKGIDPNVKKALEITYQGTPIEDLFEVQFLVANTGDKAIRDVIEPLSFAVPENCVLLDASLLHRDPPELKVELAVSKDRRSFKMDFPLLNSENFFVLKVLLNGSPRFSELKFSILVDELPPVLRAERLNFDAIGTSRKRKVELSLLTFGLIVMAFGLVLSKVIYDSWTDVPSFQGGLGAFFSRITLSALAVWLAVLPAFLLTAFGAMLSAAAMFDGNFLPAKKKFVLPESLAKSHFRVVVRSDEPEF